MSEVFDAEDGPEHAHPDAERVLRRALVLSCVVCRARLEHEANKDYADATIRRVRAWADETKLYGEFEPSERELLETPLGDLEDRQAVNGSWRSEGLYVLAWALGRQDFLAHDEMVDPVRAANSLGFLKANVLAMVPTLRPADEIDSFLWRQLALHWRLREYSLRPQAMDFAQFVRDCTWAPLEVDPCALVDNDLVIDGQRIDQADPERVGMCQSIAMERHLAINWLHGQEPIYSEVDTST